MRITNALFYQNSKSDYQKSMQGLYGVNAQMSSRMKIQNSFQDSGIFVDTMRLNYEVATLEQVKETSSKAQTFANNTDKTLSQFSDALDQFKTKMIQASSQVHSSTSLNAIANELEALKTHMISLANTSINGQFLFSGSSLSVKPISNDGTYNGNDQKLEAIIGSGVQIPFNIDGNYLFEGIDSDYNRVVSTNVTMYNQSKLYPDRMVLDSGVTESEEIYLSADDTIRDMVGDVDTSETNDPNAVFHISGRRPDGTTFSSSVEMQSDEKVSALLKKIGDEFGNTPTNTVVDVSMNDHGQIEIKDLKVGNQQLQFHIVGAVDRTAMPQTEGNADNQNLISENVQIVEFIKSNFQSANTTSSISSRQDITTPGQFSLGAPMFQANGDFVETSTKLRSFMGDEISQIRFGGADNFGTSINPIPPLDALQIDDNTTVQQLLSALGDTYGVSTRLEDGQIYLNTGSSTDFSTNKLAVKLDALKYTGNGEVQSLEFTSPVSANGNITLTLPNAATVNVAVLNGDTTEDIATKIEAAVGAIQGADASIVSVRADGNQVYFDFAQSAGDVANISVNPNATGAVGTVSVEANYVVPGLSEVQRIEIKEAPSVNGTFTLENINPANNVVVNFNAGDTPTAIATAIQAAVGAVVPFTDANGNDITSVSVSNGKITFNYDSYDGNVLLAPVAISQTAGIDDLIITNAYDRTITEGSGTISVNAFTTFDSLNLNKYNFEVDGNKLSSNTSQVIKATNEYASASTKLSEVSGASTLDKRVFEFNFTNKNGTQSQGQINLEESSPYSTFQIDFDNSGTYEENEIIPLFNAKGEATKASEVTYGQLMDVVTLALGNQQPIDKDTKDASGNFSQIADGNLFEEYENALNVAKSNIEVYLDDKGKMVIEDTKNTSTKMQFNLSDYDLLDVHQTTSAFSFMANDAIAIEDPSISFFSDIDAIINAVRNGEFQMDSSNEDPRSLGLNNSLYKIDHLMDHVNKSQTVIGSYSNALMSSQERAELLSVNVQTVRSEVIDVDLAEAYLKFEQLSTSYQAMLSTVSKINSMSLLNYM